MEFQYFAFNFNKTDTYIYVNYNYNNNDDDYKKIRAVNGKCMQYQIALQIQNLNEMMQGH